MSTKSLLRLFPEPAYITLPAIGLDVSDQSIKFVELVAKPRGLVLGHYGHVSIPLGIIASGKIVDQEKLVPILAALKKDKNISYVRVSLPEEQVYSFRLTLTDVTEKELRNTIEFSLEEHIPIAAAEATFDFAVISQTGNAYNVQVCAAQTVLIQNYMDVFAEAGLYPLSFELEGTALARALIKKGDLNTYMIVDFGETRTGISIVANGVTLFSSTVEIGGYAITKMIEKKYSIPFEEAEKMKRTFSLESSQSSQELFKIMTDGVGVLRDEINKHFIYWQTHKDDNGGDRSPIQKIFLCGGNANMYGVGDYLSQSLRFPVELGNTWINVDGYTDEVPDMNKREALGYATAIGLVLGHFEND
ncbi:type IV pilus assembly protein PilM [Candidatus Nomurabacteria bacterium]|jgi:type IV pilus assembly protein PilM|nr:MAG: type IV pilus assembly protein PilM [Candidatus Nomurabacteria bacterium]